MIVLTDVLSRQDVLAVREELAVAPFREGGATAGESAGRVKHNEQAQASDASVIALAHRVRLALEAHPVVRSFARPARWSGLMFSRYGPDQQYGLHTDNATMYAGGGRSLRTDLSFTLFLSDPESYEGGALEVRDVFTDRVFRLDAGCAVLYPTGCLHRVGPVTSGVRLACVGWIQSQVRRADQREILYDIEQARHRRGADDSALLLDKAIGNLLRMWSED